MKLANWIKDHALADGRTDAHPQVRRFPPAVHPVAQAAPAYLLEFEMRGSTAEQAAGHLESLRPMGAPWFGETQFREDQFGQVIARRSFEVPDGWDDECAAALQREPSLPI